MDARARARRSPAVHDYSCGPLHGSASVVSPQGLGLGVMPAPPGTVFSMGTAKAGITPRRATAPRISLQVARTRWRRGNRNDASASPPAAAGGLATTLGSPRRGTPDAWAGPPPLPGGRRRMGGGHPIQGLLRIDAPRSRPARSRLKSSITRRFPSPVRPDYRARLPTCQGRRIVRHVGMDGMSRLPPTVRGASARRSGSVAGLR